MQKELAPNFSDILAAAERINGVANKTPVITSRTINNELDAELFFKCENLQKMGAFKFRGAYNFLSSLSEGDKAKGVVAYSSGNHAQAVALSAKILGIKATIVMPKDAPKSKLEATKGYGGKVVLYDRYTEDNVAISNQIAKENGYIFMPPFNHKMIIAGQGTAALELINEVGNLDAIVTPLGGGGLLSGSAIATNHLLPTCKIYGVEPAAGNDGLQSFKKGEIVKIESPRTIADGAQTPSLGTITFPIIQKYVSDILTATDDELIDAMSFFAERMKLIVEPTGCLGLAAIRKHKDMFRGKKIGIIVSGGNVDLSKFSELLTG